MEVVDEQPSRRRARSELSQDSGPRILDGAVGGVIEDLDELKESLGSEESRPSTRSTMAEGRLRSNTSVEETTGTSVPSITSAIGMSSRLAMKGPEGATELSRSTTK